MGNPINVYKYIRDQGIAEGSDYPFKAKESDSCKYNASMLFVNVSGYRYVPIRNDDFLRVRSLPSRYLSD